MAGEARGAGCVAEFVRPDSADRNGLSEECQGAKRVDPTAAMRLDSHPKSQRLKQIGGIAQLVERLVRNEKVRGSNPLTSTFLWESGDAPAAYPGILHRCCKEAISTPA